MYSIFGCVGISAAQVSASDLDGDIELCCLPDQMGFIGVASNANGRPYQCPNTHNVIAFSGRLDDHSNICNKLLLQDDTPADVVIAKAYEIWGELLTQNITGDYQFAVWDAQKRRLYCAQSPFVSMCLLYYQRGSRLYFSSLPALLKQLIPEPLRLDPEKINRLLWSDFSVAEQSCYQSVKRLMHSHQLVFDDNSLRVKQYWSALDFHKQPQLCSNYEEAVALGKSIISRAVAQRIPENLSVMTHLSGGLDSSTVTVLAADQIADAKGDLLAYSAMPQDDLAFPERDRYKLNDYKHINDVANHRSNIHSHIYVPKYTDGQLSDLAQFCFQNTDTPIKNPFNMVWMQEAYQVAVGHDKSVILEANRGNLTLSRASKMGGLLDGCKKIVKKCIGWRSCRSSNSQADLANLPQPSIQHEDITLFAEYTREHSKQFAFISYVFSEVSSISQALQHDSGVRLLDPMADQRLIEFCLQLPDKYFCYQGVKRSLIRDVTKGILPDSVRLNMFRGEQNPGWFYQLKRQAPYYMSLIPKLRRDPLVSELLNINELERLLKSLAQIDLKNIMHYKATDLTREYRQKLGRGLHIAEWIHLHST